ncbi:Aspartate aminotransferase, cytoplasmic [Capsicum baccatum]|uniref:Aspartate aminotransferase, cytoplasmic n=1 Tax=Capsicum baccatum TaxID=33114 RepID=A0A2G2VFV4_CAPBA|nr:Aspartate aminotransferase, cytoplasmic [Capsicum baccatum]
MNIFENPRIFNHHFPMADSFNSIFAHVVPAPEDPILWVTVTYNKNTSLLKVNLGVGAYRTKEEKPFVLNVVRRAKQMFVHNTSQVKEYLAITGLVDFNKLSAKLIFSADSRAIQEIGNVASKVESQLKLVTRILYSNPPIHGASIVATILKDRQMYDEWTVELKAMTDRIISTRQKLFDAMQARGTPGDWSHNIKQIGMFIFTGSNAEQVFLMTREYHTYMTSDGRISMTGLSSRTVPHLVDVMHDVVTKRI